VSSRLEESEKKFGVELGQIREQIKAYQAENSSSAGLTQQTRDEFEKRIIIMEKKLDDIRQEQRDLNSNISIQKAQLESFKTTTAITMNDIKANQSQLEEVQLKKLDQTIEQLSKSIDSLKTNASLNDSLSSTKISDSNRLENFHSFGHSGSASTHQEGQVRDRSGLDAYRSEQHSYEQVRITEI
jgi:chromosome segregation ATPase